MKNEKRLNDLKEQVDISVKAVVTLFMMTLGFFISYAFVWDFLGFSITKNAIVLLFITACFSEYRYYKWMKG